MIEIKTKLRKWGNSLGVVVPQHIIDKEKTKVGDDVTILFKRNDNNLLRDVFDTHKFSKNTDELLKEVDEELYND